MKLRIARKIRWACILSLLSATPMRHSKGSVKKALRVCRKAYKRTGVDRETECAVSFFGFQDGKAEFKLDMLFRP